MSLIEIKTLNLNGREAIDVNMNTLMRFSATVAGVQEYVKAYNFGLSEMYHKKQEDVRDNMKMSIGEFANFFSSCGKSDTDYNNLFAEDHFIVAGYIGDKYQGKETIFKVPKNPIVMVDFTEEGLKVCAEVLTSETFDVKEVDYQTLPKQAFMKLSRLIYLVGGACFNGSVRMPFSENNRIKIFLN